MSLDMLTMNIDAKDWEYFAEGNTKIIYKQPTIHLNNNHIQHHDTHHIPHDITHDNYVIGNGNIVLKLLKISKSTNEPENVAERIKILRSDLLFVNRVLRPHIGDEFLPKVQHVCIDISSASEVETDCIDSSCGSHHPHHDHRYSIVDMIRRNMVSSVGILESNLALSQFNGSSLSFELKLKCGFRSFSPYFNMDTMLIKHRCHRFQLLQLSKQYDRENSGKHPRWGEIHQTSQYHPLHLMSQDPELIQSSLRAILSNPQNNLGIRWNGRLVFGWGENEISSSDAEQIRFFLEQNGSDSSMPIVDSSLRIGYPHWQSACSSVLGDVMKTAPIFQQLKLLQALDVIDVEGCQIVFHRLISLLGSEAAAIEAVENQHSQPLPSCIWSVLSNIVQFHESIDCRKVEKAGASVHICQPKSYLDVAANAPRDSRLPHRLTVLVEEVSSFTMKKYFPDNSQPSQSYNVLGKSGTESIDKQLQDWTDNLSVADCSLLLSAWLIALTASDMSVIITYTAVPLEPTVNSHHQEQAASLIAEPDIQLKVQSGSVGQQLVQLEQVVSSIRFSRIRENLNYSIGLVDFYPKPTSKIISKGLLESEICRKASIIASKLGSGTNLCTCQFCNHVYTL